VTDAERLASLILVGLYDQIGEVVIRVAGSRRLSDHQFSKETVDEAIGIVKTEIHNARVNRFAEMFPVDEPTTRQIRRSK